MKTLLHERLRSKERKVDQNLNHLVMTYIELLDGSSLYLTDGEADLLAYEIEHYYIPRLSTKVLKGGLNEETTA